jgi:dipeptidyl aminopeptidase/acylaminoacyl peptidase
MLTWLLAGLGIAAGGVVAAAWLFARLWCRPRRTCPQKDPGSLGLDYEEVRLTGPTGQRLHAWFVPEAGRARRGPGLVLVHGWSRNRSQLLHLVPPLRDRGFSVLLFDARGHGHSDSDGPITIRKIAEDVLAAVEYLARRNEVDPDRIAVVGHSIGAGAAILAASLEKRIHAVVSSSAFADPALLTTRVLRRLHFPTALFHPLVRMFIQRWLGTSMEQVSPMHRIQRISVPILLIHGLGDRFIPASDLGLLHDRAASRDLRAWLVPRRDHSSVLFHPEAGIRIAEFLSEVLVAPARVDGNDQAQRIEMIERD